MTIYRQNLALTNDRQEILVPRYSKLLKIANWKGISIWYEADTPSVTDTEWYFHIVGTGHSVPPNTKYIDSVTFPETGLVWHIYQEL